MAKYRIYDEGKAFFDDYGINSNDVGGVRINGSCVERLGKNGNWFTAYNAGKPIDRLLWTENGAINAVTDDGKVVYANVNLAHNPNNRTKIREITIDDTAKSSKKAKKEKEEEYEESDSGMPAIIRWPLKGIWWLIKTLFWTLLFGSIMSSNDKK